MPEGRLLDSRDTADVDISTNPREICWWRSAARGPWRNGLRANGRMPITAGRVRVDRTAPPESP